MSVLTTATRLCSHHITTVLICAWECWQLPPDCAVTILQLCSSAHECVDNCHQTVQSPYYNCAHLRMRVLTTATRLCSHHITTVLFCAWVCWQLPPDRAATILQLCSSAHECVDNRHQSTQPPYYNCALLHMCADNRHQSTQPPYYMSHCTVLKLYHTDAPQ
jgi:hypothetical protein